MLSARYGAPPRCWRTRFTVAWREQCYSRPGPASYRSSSRDNDNTENWSAIYSRHDGSIRSRFPVFMIKRPSTLHRTSVTRHTRPICSTIPTYSRVPRLDHREKRKHSRAENKSVSRIPIRLVRSQDDTSSLKLGIANEEGSSLRFTRPRSTWSDKHIAIGPNELKLILFVRQRLWDDEHSHVPGAVASVQSSSSAKTVTTFSLAEGAEIQVFDDGLNVSVRIAESVHLPTAAVQKLAGSSESLPSTARDMTTLKSIPVDSYEANTWPFPLKRGLVGRLTSENMRMLRRQLARGLPHRLKEIEFAGGLEHNHEAMGTVVRMILLAVDGHFNRLGLSNVDYVGNDLGTMRRHSSHSQYKISQFQPESELTSRSHVDWPKWTEGKSESKATSEATSEADTSVTAESHILVQSPADVENGRSYDKTTQKELLTQIFKAFASQNSRQATDRLTQFSNNSAKGHNEDPFVNQTVSGAITHEAIGSLKTAQSPQHASPVRSKGHKAPHLVLNTDRHGVNSSVNYDDCDKSTHECSQSQELAQHSSQNPATSGSKLQAQTTEDISLQDPWQDINNRRQNVSSKVPCFRRPTTWKGPVKSYMAPSNQTKDTVVQKVEGQSALSSPSFAQNAVLLRHHAEHDNTKNTDPGPQGTVEVPLLDDLFPPKSLRRPENYPATSGKFVSLKVGSGRRHMSAITSSSKSRLDKQYENKDQEAAEDELTILFFSNASKELLDEDFRRLIPKGQHLSDWQNAGTYDKVIPGRDPDTMERKDHYYIIFSSAAAAQDYQSNVFQMHSIAHKYTQTSVASSISPPPGYLIDGVNVDAVKNAYAICYPSTQPPQMKMLVKPYKPQLIQLAKAGGYPELTTVRHTHRVLLKIEGAPLREGDMRNFIHFQGKLRSLAYSLVESSDAIFKVDVQSRRTHEPVPDMYDDLFEEHEPGNKTGTHREHSEESNLWVVSFVTDAEAKRFANAVHERQFPWRQLGIQQNMKPFERSARVTAEVLW